MRNISSSLLCLSAISLMALGGCTPAGVVAGAGATAGISVAQEGGVSRALRDARIQAQINDLWFRYDVDTFRKLDMTVNNGRVLLTGIVQDPEDRVEAVRLAWQPDGVTQVINEIRVADSRSFGDYAKDNWITARLRGALTFDSDVRSINYSIDTVRGTVYLIGAAQNQTELNRVIEVARTTPDVQQVVSYVRLVGEPIDNVAKETLDSPIVEPSPYDRSPIAEIPPEDIAPAAGVEQSSVEVMPLDPPVNYSGESGLRPEDHAPATGHVATKPPERIIWHERRNGSAANE